MGSLSLLLLLLIAGVLIPGASDRAESDLLPPSQPTTEIKVASPAKVEGRVEGAGNLQAEHVPVDFGKAPFDVSMNLSARLVPAERTIPASPLVDPLLNRVPPSVEAWDTETLGPTRLLNPTLSNRWRRFRWQLRHFLQGGRITLPGALPLSVVVAGAVRDPMFMDGSIRVYYAPGLDSTDRLIQPVLTTNGLQVVPVPLTFRQLLASNGISVVRLSRTRWKVFPTSQVERFGNDEEPAIPDPDPGAAARGTSTNRR